MVIKMLTELGKRMHEHSENFNREGKYLKVPKRSLRAEEYNNQNEGFRRRLNG